MISAPAFSFLAPRSDGDGNLFIRPNVSGADDIVLFKLSKDDDSENRMYKLPPQASQANEFIDFAVTSSGQPYVLTEGEKEKSHVFSFDSDGSVKSDTVLEVPEHIHPLNLGVFENGSILVVGYYSIGDDSPESLKGKSYSAMFGPSGQLIRNLSKIFSLEGTKPDTTSGFASISIRSGADGYLYVLKPQAVLAVSPGGAIVRRVRFVKPEPSKQTYSLEVSEGLLCIELVDKLVPGKAPGMTYLVVDATTGKEYGYYAAPTEVKGIFARFTREDGFTFLANEKGKLRISTAALN